MCSYGPVVLGHQHPAVEAAAAAQAAAVGDCQNAPGPGHGGPGRAAGGDRPARRLGHVRQERHRRHHHVLHDRPRADRPAQDPGGHGRLPRRRALVHAAAGRHHRGRPGQPRLLHLQRPGQRPAGRGRGRRRPGRHPGQPVQARRRVRPGAGRPRVRPRPARAVRRRRGRADPGRRALRVPAAPRAPAGSRSAWTPTCRPGARPSPTATRSPRCWAATRSATARSSVFVTGSFWFSAVPDGGRGRHDRRAAATRTPSRPWSGRAPRCATASWPRRRSWDLPVNYTGPAVMPYLTFAGDTRPRAGQRVRGAGPARRRLPAPAAQLVRVRRHDRRRPRPGARGDRPGVRRRPQADQPVLRTGGGSACPVRQPSPTRPRPHASRPRWRPTPRRRSSSGPATSRSCGGRCGSSPCSRSRSRSSRSPPASS